MHQIAKLNEETLNQPSDEVNIEATSAMSLFGISEHPVSKPKTDKKKRTKKNPSSSKQNVSKDVVQTLTPGTGQPASDRSCLKVSNKESDNKNSDLMLIPDDEVGSPSASQTSENEKDSLSKPPLFKSKERDEDNVLDELDDLQAFPDKPLDTLSHLQVEITSLSTNFKDMVSLLKLAKVLKNTKLRGRREQESSKTPEDDTAEQVSTKDNVSCLKGNLVIHDSEVKASEAKTSEETNDEPPKKKLKFLIPRPTPLRSILPDPPRDQRKGTFGKKITLEEAQELLRAIKRHADLKAADEDQLSAKHQLVIKGLADGKASVSNLRDIQVKDIIKEVKDYLKTYSSAEMDIRCAKVRTFSFICMSDTNLQVPLEEIEIDDKLHFLEEPVDIVEQEVKKLKRKRIFIVKQKACIPELKRRYFKDDCSDNQYAVSIKEEVPPKSKNDILPQDNNDIKIELGKEFLVELRKNAHHGWIDEDVMNHITKVLKEIDLIYIPGVDSYQLRMKVFPLSLADDARQWWINEGEGKITVWEELVEKFFCKFYPESYDGEDETWTKETTRGLIHLNSYRE
nr:hypothetical protein [Tanacetum cinerariifolium]